MLKYILMALLFFIALSIGAIVSAKYRKRANFFKALVLICQKLNVEISFSRERIKTLLASFDDKTKSQLCGLTENYLAFIDQESPLDKASLFKGITFLKEEESDLIFLFFRSLGRSDVDSQSKELKNFESRFDEMVSSATAENKKYGSMSMKLGLIAGLAVIILLI